MILSHSPNMGLWEITFEVKLMDKKQSLKKFLLKTVSYILVAALASRAMQPVLTSTKALL